MAEYRVIVAYKDGSKRILETADGTMAMAEAGNSTYPSSQEKTVTLEKDGESIWSEKIKVEKSRAMPG